MNFSLQTILPTKEQPGIFKIILMMRSSTLWEPMQPQTLQTSFLYALSVIPDKLLGTFGGKPTLRERSQLISSLWLDEMFAECFVRDFFASVRYNFCYVLHEKGIKPYSCGQIIKHQRNYNNECTRIYETQLFVL